MTEEPVSYPSSNKQLCVKALCLLDPDYFLGNILGYQVEPHHRAIHEHITRTKKTLDLAPRGFGKSTIGDIGYCLWKIAQNRNVRILIVSNTQGQAEAFLREIKAHLEGNTRLIELFGRFSSDKWTESELSVAGRTITSKEATLTALGASGSVITKHFDVIIADDIVDFENARTELQRKKLSEWYRTALLPTLEPHGELHVIGTRYHPNDLYQELIDSLQYSAQVERAIRDNQSLWPAKFSIEGLLQKKAELGSIIFDLQYQNNITLAKQGRIFRYEWMQFYDVPPQGIKIYQGCDLAISEKETADYFVLMTIGADLNGNIYVLDIYRERLSFKAQQEIVRLKAQQWQPVAIGIEINQYQKALAQELIRTTSLPIKELQTVKDKVARAQRRSALFENKKVYLRRDMTTLVDELCLFPDAAHDDLFDAFDFAVTVNERANIPSQVPNFTSISYGAGGGLGVY
ncbi:MAG TPA: phage terminase large subunit [Candidatus Methanoperedenaceae archaeon]|nr:phage terminase large subunit [Candidatus Methanoperedenaceae archaeon]